MANTFKLKTNAAMPASAGTPDALYTVPASTTTVIVGFLATNVQSSQVLLDVKIVSSTSDTETNETVFIIKDAPIPAGASLELMGGNKVIVQTTDVVQVDCDTTAGVDVTMSIMEIT